MQTSFNHLSNIQTYVVPLRGTHVADYRPRLLLTRIGCSPTRLGSDFRQFLLHAELPPSSARLDFSEKLLSSSLPFRFILFYIILLQKRLFVKVLKRVFEK